MLSLRGRRIIRGVVKIQGRAPPGFGHRVGGQAHQEKAGSSRMNCGPSAGVSQGQPSRAPQCSLEQITQENGIINFDHEFSKHSYFIMFFAKNHSKSSLRSAAETTMAFLRLSRAA
jgi:hypothetical protein